MKKKLIATFLSMALFGALNTAHCAETSVYSPNSEVSNINTAIFSPNQDPVTAAISGSEKADEELDTEQDLVTADIFGSGNDDKKVDTEQDPVTAAISDSEKDDKNGDGQEKQGADGRSNVIQLNNLPVLGSPNQFADTQTNQFSNTQANKFADAQTNHWDQRPQENSAYKMIQPTEDTWHNIADKVVKLLGKIHSPNIKYNNISTIDKIIRGGLQVNMGPHGRYPGVHQHTQLKGRPDATLHITLPGECSQGEYYNNLTLQGWFNVYRDRQNSGLQIVIMRNNKLRGRNPHINVLQWLNHNDAETLRKTLRKNRVYITIKVDGPPQCKTYPPTKHPPSTYLPSNYQKNVANK